MKRCFPESSLPPSSLPLSAGRMPRAQCTQNSIMFNMHYTSKTRTTNWFLVWPLNTVDTGVLLMPACLLVCQSVSLSVYLTPCSPFSYRVVFLFRAVRSTNCLPIRTSLVGTLLKLFQVSWHGDNSVVWVSERVLFKWCWTMCYVLRAKQKNHCSHFRFSF